MARLQEPLDEFKKVLESGAPVQRDSLANEKMQRATADHLASIEERR